MEINEERRKIQLEAVDALERHNYNGIVILPTGAGKSWVMIECLKKIKYSLGRVPSILYLCNSQDLRDVTFRKELENWDALEFIDDMQLMCYHSAHKLKDKQFDILLCDEYDYSLTNVYSKVYFNNKFTHKILVTATIEGEEKILLSNKIGKVVYSRNMKYAEDKSILNKSNYYFITYKISASENKIYLEILDEFSDLLFKKNDVLSRIEISGEDKEKLKKQLAWINKQIELLIFKRKHFLNSLETSKDVCKRLLEDIRLDNKARTLVFCEMNKQASAISDNCYHSDSDGKTHLNAFIDGTINEIAVCGKINRGVNLPGVNNIVFESCNQSRTQITQRIGRGKRLGVNDVLNVYFLIPHYATKSGWWKPTKVGDWVRNATKGVVDLSGARLYKFKERKEKDENVYKLQ